MTTICVLTIEDMQLAIANYVGCKPEDVTIYTEKQMIGYGMDEHTEYVVRCTVTKS